jgi:hypothetical protein
MKLRNCRSPGTVMALASLALPGLAQAHPGHAATSGLVDVLLHYPWTLGLVALAGAWAWRAGDARRAARRRRR